MGLDVFPQPVMGASQEVPDHAAATTEEPMRLTPGSHQYGSEVLVDGFSGQGWNDSVRLGRVTGGEGYTDSVKLPPRSSDDGAVSGGILGGIGRTIGNFFKAIGRGFLSWFGIKTGSQSSTVSSRTVGLVDPGEVSTGGGMDLSSLQPRAPRAPAVEERVSVYYTGRHSNPVIVRRPVVRPETVVARPPIVRCAIP